MRKESGIRVLSGGGVLKGKEKKRREWVTGLGLVVNFAAVRRLTMNLMNVKGFHYGRLMRSDRSGM